MGTQRVFACALAWPGWCRSATTEVAAIAALASYAARYAAVARGSRQRCPLDRCWRAGGHPRARLGPADGCGGNASGDPCRGDTIDHVHGAEAAYARKLGVKHRQPARDDAPAIAALRAAILRDVAGTLRRPVACRVGLAAPVRGPSDRLAHAGSRVGDGRSRQPPLIADRRCAQMCQPVRRSCYDERSRYIDGDTKRRCGED